MADDTAIKTALERVVAVYERKPDKAYSTSRAVATIEGGLKCVTRDGSWELVSDMPVIMGGEAAGPTPGVYARAGIASCAAMSIQIAAERAGIEIRGLTVRIEMDWDDRGVLAMGDAPAGALGTRLDVEIDSPAAQSVVRALVTDAMDASPIVENMLKQQMVETTISISGEA